MRQEKRNLRKGNRAVLLAGMFLLCLPVLCALSGRRAHAAGGEEQVIASYQAYEERFDRIRTMWDITEQGYEIVEKHVFDIPLVKYLPEQSEEGEILTAEVIRPGSPFGIAAEDAVSVQQVPTVRFFSAMEKDSHRAAVFLADRNGDIVYKCNQLECNYTLLGELEQPIVDIVSVAFQDLNEDGLMDIILIAGCVNDTGEYAGELYKVGEVLFQSPEGPGDVNGPGDADGSEAQTGKVSFYRDYRVNDKINRFGMNKSAACIISFVRDGKSAEFLYTATREEELLENGFEVIQTQSYWRNYEKLGKLKILPGTYHVSYYAIFMVYLVDEDGNIIWSFQPMGDYDNLYSLKGMSGKDLDGDGMKDMLVVARYSREGENGEMIVDGCYSVYYQRTGGFDADTEITKLYPYNGNETVEELTKRIRAYWGWQPEEE